MPTKNGLLQLLNADVIEYLKTNSLRQTKQQSDLEEETSKLPHGGMLGSSDSLQLCSNLIQMISGKKVIDVGVFTGISTLAWALAIPEHGKVYSLDITDEAIEVGRPYWKKAGIEHKINLMISPALESLKKLMIDGHQGTFDFAFIDADKSNYISYYEECLKLLRKGGLIAVDNTLWSGRVVNPEDQTPTTVDIRKFNEYVKDDERINISFLAVGDGLTLCFKK